jgi:hypothetical protein
VPSIPAIAFSAGQLLAGDATIYVNDPNGLFSADDLQIRRRHGCRHPRLISNGMVNSGNKWTASNP